MSENRPPENQVPRWQVEIEEILVQTDRESTSFEKARAAAIATRYKAPDRAKRVKERATSRLGTGIWLLAAVITGISAWIVGLHTPFAGRVLAIASLLLFVAFLVSAVMRSRQQQSSPKLWRGQIIDNDSPPIWNVGSRHRRNDDDDPPLVGSGR